MRWWLLALPVLIGAAAIGSGRKQAEFVLVFSGDLRGYLAPCGCSDPKVGGIKRLASVAKALKSRPEAFVADIGNWTLGSGRQDQLKAEAIAETYRSTGADFLNVGALDLRFGTDYLRSLDEASGGAIRSCNVLAFQSPGVVKNGVWVCGLADEKDPAVSGQLGASYDDVFGSAPAGMKQVVLFAGGRERATELARAYPSISLIVYSSLGDAHDRPIRVGTTLLVTPGDKGRVVGVIELAGGEWGGFRLVELGPEHHEDVQAADAYTAYLRRVTDEKLIEQLPRSDKGQYVGSKACASCHVTAYESWKRSDHYVAMPTLAKDGHDHDPDCVGCHVVGLDATTGFRDMKTTPDLAGVGCESCHGPGALHVSKPTLPYGPVGSASCAPCHNKDHSPNFAFKEYWEKIRH